MMAMTSVSLLDRLKAASSEASDWRRLREIYLPLITRWLRRIPGMNAEINDLTQEVFVVMAREIPRFDRQREGSFRAWLRQPSREFSKGYGKRSGSFWDTLFFSCLVAMADDLCLEEQQFPLEVQPTIASHTRKAGPWTEDTEKEQKEFHPWLESA